MNEEDRILQVYSERERKSKLQFLGHRTLADFMMREERLRKTIQLIQQYGFNSESIRSKKILEVGCGNGNMLLEYLKWGAVPENLAAIDLFSDRVDVAKRIMPHVDIRCGSASDLPWENQTFDLVAQHVVFSSILDENLAKKIAQEMIRVLKPSGMILWYDFFYDNPHNPDVKGIQKNYIESLFPGLSLNILRVTLAPPIGRNIPSVTLPILYPVLSSMPFLCTHYLAILKS